MAKDNIIRFLCSCEWSKTLRQLPDASRLKIYDAIFEYAETGIVHKLNLTEKIAFATIQSELDRDDLHNKIISERRRDNVMKRWGKNNASLRNDENTNNNNTSEKKEQASQTDTNVYNCIQMNTNEYNCIQMYDDKSTENDENASLRNDENTNNNNTSEKKEQASQTDTNVYNCIQMNDDEKRKEKVTQKEKNKEKENTIQDINILNLTKKKKNDDSSSHTKFFAPTVAEVKDYMLYYVYEKKKNGTVYIFNNEWAERFVDFYTSKGWKVGSQSMKDWRAAARNWVRTNQQRARQGNVQADSAHFTAEGNREKYKNEADLWTKAWNSQNQ